MIINYFDVVVNSTWGKYMKKNLDEINIDILKQIDDLDVDVNVKNFLKEALYEEYSNRDENYTISDKRNENYEQLINKYYGGGD